MYRHLYKKLHLFYYFVLHNTKVFIYLCNVRFKKNYPQRREGRKPITNSQKTNTKTSFFFFFKNYNHEKTYYFTFLA